MRKLKSLVLMLVAILSLSVLTGCSSNNESADKAETRVVKTEKGDVDMKAVNIMWDTDGDKKLFEELPSEVEIPDNVDEEDIGDYISDLIGFCHFGYDLED